MKLYDQLVDKAEKLSLVGLGYVGMPIAVAFAKKINVIGFDLNAKKIELYKLNEDDYRCRIEGIRNIIKAGRKRIIIQTPNGV